MFRLSSVQIFRIASLMIALFCLSACGYFAPPQHTVGILDESENLNTLDLSSKQPKTSSTDHVNLENLKDAKPIINQNKLRLPLGEDEQVFTYLGHEDKEEKYFSRTKLIEPEKHYWIYVYFANNSTIKSDQSTVAKNAKLYVYIPKKINRYESMYLTAGIQSDNQYPSKIWNSVVVKTNADYLLNIQLKEVSYYSIDGNLNFTTTAQDYLDQISTYEGAAIYCNGIKGQINPGCSGYALIKFTAKKLNYLLSSEISLNDGPFKNFNVFDISMVNFNGNINRAKLKLRTSITNTGQGQLDNIIISNDISQSDKLIIPDKSGYITVTFFRMHGDKRRRVHHIVDLKNFNSGINLGSLSPGESISISVLFFPNESWKKELCKKQSAKVGFNIKVDLHYQQEVSADIYLKEGSCRNKSK